MSKQFTGTFLVLCSLPFICACDMEVGGLNKSDFVRISENGFDPADNRVDWNDYPWAMLHFTPDAKAEGHLYVGTGNGIDELILAALGQLGEDSGERPPEIRRYRPDVGRLTWERVFDYRDFEVGPDFTATGIRNMSQYRSQSDGVNRLYASTFGAEPTVWRTATGDPGSWELFWSATTGRGSIRWMTEHNGLLYLAIANDVTAEGDILSSPGQILATDGDTIWPVMEDGFGNPDNGAIMSLISHDGWLWAGTANMITGFEIWKLEGPGGEGPVQVVSEGATTMSNQVAATPYVYKGDLYWGSMIFLGMFFKGCVLIRINDDDTWDTIVGPDGLSGYGAGFDNRNNGYLWWLEEHEGWLYAGTCDFTSQRQAVFDTWVDFVAQFIGLFGETAEHRFAEVKRDPGLVGIVSQGGGDLWKSEDGVHWIPVFRNGLGDTFNWGVRIMQSVNGVLYLGLANPWDGFEIWSGTEDAQE